MSWTKQQIIEQAFSEIGYGTYAYDLEPEQMAMALHRLDSMVAAWNVKGIAIGYPVHGTQATSDASEDSNLPVEAIEAVYTNLAVRLAPTVGKQLMPETRTNAAMLYRNLLQRTATPSQKQFPQTMPRGAGNKPWRDDDPFYGRPQNKIEDGLNPAGQQIYE